MKGWSDVSAFLDWTLAVCAIAKALFGSLLSAEVHYRLAVRDAPRRQRMSRLNWEVNNRVRWSDDALRQSPHAAKVPLTPEELDEKGRELRQLTKVSFGIRAIRYFANCVACQSFWCAIAVHAATRGFEVPLAAIASSFAYSAAAVILSRASDFGRASPVDAVGDRSRCKSCGK